MRPVFCFVFFLLLCALAGLETGHYEDELDVIARELNISRQAVIKTLIRQALDQRHLARSSRRR